MTSELNRRRVAKIKTEYERLEGGRCNRAMSNDSKQAKMADLKRKTGFRAIVE
jgi:hypothetical protein